MFGFGRHKIFFVLDFLVQNLFGIKFFESIPDFVLVVPILLFKGK